MASPYDPTLPNFPDFWNLENDFGLQPVEDALFGSSDFNQLPSTSLDATGFPFLSDLETPTAFGSPLGDYSALDSYYDPLSSGDTSTKDDSPITVPPRTSESSPVLSASGLDSHMPTSRVTTANLGVRIPGTVFQQCTLCHQSFASPARLQ